MKLTNKILLIAAAAILIATTIFAIKLTSVVEYTPQPFKESFDVVKKRFSKLREIEISGEYNVEIVVAEKDSLELFGPDLLVKKHSVIEEQNGNLKIKSNVILSNYPFVISLKIYTRNLESISLKNGVFLQIFRMNGDSLRVLSQDSSIAKISNGNFNYVRIEAFGKSMVSLEKAKISSFNLKEEAMLAINTDKIINELCSKEPLTVVISNRSLHFENTNSKTIDAPYKIDSTNLISDHKLIRNYVQYKNKSTSYYASSNYRNLFRALKQYITLLKKQPSNSDLVIETADCFEAVGQNLLALKILEQAYSKDKSNTNLLGELVWKYRIVDKPIEAKKCAQILVKKYPNNKTYLETYARTLLEVGELSEGEKTIKKLQEWARPNEFEILRLQGIIDVYKAKRKTKDI